MQQPTNQLKKKKALWRITLWRNHPFYWCEAVQFKSGGEVKNQLKTVSARKDRRQICLLYPYGCSGGGIDTLIPGADEQTAASKKWEEGGT